MYKNQFGTGFQLTVQYQKPIFVNIVCDPRPLNIAEVEELGILIDKNVSIPYCSAINIAKYLLLDTGGLFIFCF